MSESINIIIADPQFITAHAIQSLIPSNNCVKQIVVSKEELLTALKNDSYSILFIDCFLLDFDSLKDLKIIQNKYPLLNIVIMVNSISKLDVMELKKMNIQTIILKTAESNEIPAVIDAVLHCKRYYSEEIMELLLEAEANINNSEPQLLTPSEIEIVKGIAQGLTTKEIAEKKHLSFHTVMTHRKNIFRKLRINNSSELIMYAVNRGIIDSIEYYI